MGVAARLAQPPGWQAPTFKPSAGTKAGHQVGPYKEEASVNWKTFAYRALRTSNDVNAVRRGRVGRRGARRVYGRATGKLARKLFG